VFPIRGLGRWKDTMHKGSEKTWLPFKGVTLLLKATLPTCVLSHRGPSLLQHAPRSSPYNPGAGSHASCKLAQGRRSQTAARGACNCPAVTSIPPLSPRPAGERADSHAGGMQPRQVEPVPRLEAALRMTQQCQPGASVTGQSAVGEGATVNMAKNGPAVMAVAGGRKQRSRRQPSSRPREPSLAA
jgi:hypothetical protein